MPFTRDADRLPTHALADAFDSRPKISEPPASDDKATERTHKARELRGMALANVDQGRESGL